MALIKQVEKKLEGRIERVEAKVEDNVSFFEKISLIEKNI